MSTELPILDGVKNREYCLRSASGIAERGKLLCNTEQPLVALLLGENSIRSDSDTGSMKQERVFRQMILHIIFPL